MATFVKRKGPDGRWVWQVRVRKRGYPPRARTFSLKANAEAWAKQLEREIEAGRAGVRSAEAERTMLAEAVTRYEREILPGLRGGGQEIARRLCRLRERLEHFPLAALDSSDIAEYRDARLHEGASAQTVKHELGLLNRVLRACIIDWGIPLPRGLVTAQVRKPSLPQGRDRRLLPGCAGAASRPGAAGEEERLPAACEAYGGPITAIVTIAIETAMRLGEIAAMRWEHLDRAARVLRVPETKAGVPRRVPLSSRALAVLGALAAPQGAGGAVWGIRADGISQAFVHVGKRARAGYEAECAAAGAKPDPRMLRDLRFHDLRHEATSRLFERGLNPMEVSAITGHKTLQMLKRYTYLQAKDLV